MGSYARFGLQIQAGYKLIKIGDTKIEAGSHSADLESLLNQELLAMPPWPLVLTFNTHSNGTGESVTQEFTQMPIGIDFANSTPVRISTVYPKSPAEAAGIQAGWYITKIGE